MAIFATRKVLMKIGAVPDHASSYYIDIFSMYLSQPYELMTGDEIRGEIIHVRKGEKEYPDLRGKPITFILGAIIIFDLLYILKTHWQMLFREWGLVETGYEIEVKLIEATRLQTNETIELYSKADVTLM